MNPSTATDRTRELQDNKLSRVALQRHGERVVLSKPAPKEQDGPEIHSQPEGECEGEDIKVIRSLSTRVEQAGDCYVSAPCKATFPANASMEWFPNTKEKDPSYFRFQQFQTYKPEDFAGEGNYYSEVRNVYQGFCDYLEMCAEKPPQVMTYFTDRFPQQTLNPEGTHTTDWTETSNEWDEQGEETLADDEGDNTLSEDMNLEDEAFEYDWHPYQTDFVYPYDREVNEGKSIMRDDGTIVSAIGRFQMRVPGPTGNLVTMNRCNFRFKGDPNTSTHHHPPNHERSEQQPGYALANAAFDYLDKFDSFMKIHKLQVVKDVSFLQQPAGFIPSDDDLKIEFFYLKDHVPSYRRTNAAAMGKMSTHCRSNLLWTVSIKRLTKLFSVVVHRYAFGFYPGSTQDMEEQQENEVEDHVDELLKPRTQVADPDRKIEDKDSREAKRKKRDEINIERMKRYALTNPPGIRHANLVKPPQNDHLSVRFICNAQVNARSNMKLRFKKNVIDSKVYGQPYEDFAVILDETNLTRKPCDPERAYAYGYEHPGGEYREPAFDISDFADAQWDKDISLATNTDIGTIEKVRNLAAPNNPRDLIQLPYNGSHLSYGVFTPRDPVTECLAIQRLQQCLKIPGYIHVFVSKPRIAIPSVAKARDAIAYQAGQDPLRRFLKDHRQNNLGLGNLKHPRMAPLFKARDEKVYRDGFDARITNVIGTYFDHVSTYSSLPYPGIISIIAIPKSYNESLGKHMSFEGSFTMTETKETKDLPKLTPGMKGDIVFAKDAKRVWEDAWKFRVIEKGVEPGLARIALQLNRLQLNRHKAKTTTGWSERNPETTTLKHVRDLGKDFRGKADSLPFTDVTLFPEKPDEKDLKRRINSVLSIVPHSGDSDAAKSSKKLGIEVIKGRNDHQLPRFKIWEGLSPELIPLVHGITFDSPMAAKGMQKDVLLDGLDKGVVARLLLLFGTSGGGKTYTAQLAVGPHALEVEYSEDAEQDRLNRRKDLNKSMQESLKRKLQNKQREEAQASGTYTSDEELPAITLDEEQFAYLDGIKPVAPRTLSDGTRVVPGQIITMSAQNSTVDMAFQRMEKHLEALSQAAGLSPRLGIRLHSNTTESGMSVAFLRPGPKGETQDDLLTTELSLVGNDILAAMSANYRARTEGKNIKGVFDKRVTITNKSIAHRGLEILGEVESTPEVDAHFTDDERKAFSDAIQPIAKQITDLHVQGKPIAKELIKEYTRATHSLHIALIDRAHHIGCTGAMGRDKLVVSYAHPRAILMDEGSRTLQDLLFGFYGQYALAKLFAIVGDENQTQGVLFGKELDNPYFTKMTEPMMVTLAARRWLIPTLNETRRYGHPDLVRTVQIAYNSKAITAAPGTFPTQGVNPKVAQIQAFMQRRYQKKGPVLVFDVKNATNQRAGTSMFSPEIAAVSSSIAHEMAISLDNIGITEICAYKAHCILLENMNEAKQRDYIAKGMPEKAARIRAIRVATVDEYQGNENDLVIANGVKAGHQGFSYDQRRNCVLMGRGRYGMIYIDDITLISKHRNREHPLVSFVQWAGDARMLTVNSHTFAT
ncbi:hypothetical protein K504DRAFT_466792 [Pleomassaria siparia CBS 279.74]|uniref:DNA2/NAM7 helicase-like C-terminal domain-containing protein n=1 Tax=Pleomassaria siparia CBS 279.74 TaxID=1314801 RepID=A0A6G1KD62_9PLEO|nr:hypothetical protein K504DRAFT_466792 [Pleomassaria siparia CBS 279.74]